MTSNSVREANPLFRTLFVLFFFCLAWAQPVPAGETPQLIVKKEALDDGGLFFMTDIPGLYIPAPQVKTEVEMTINGIVARVRVTQSFTNNTNQWVEGIYTYPLPEKSAVDRLTMLIGERRVVGEIKEKEEARKIYEQARTEGRRASLVSQERPNIFTNEVANIGPGETIKVSIEYQDQVRFQDGEFEIRFPMVVRPRYIPGNSLPVIPEGSGWSFDTDQVPDASRITPPIINPENGPTNPVEIAIHLKPGLAVGEVISPSHPIKTKKDSDGYVITLQKGYVPADSDFILSWVPVSGITPATGLFSEKIGEDYFHLLMVIPRKSETQTQKFLPREMVFILDVSGSMRGSAIRQAKSALLLALDGLRPEDTFHLITFNENPYDFTGGAIPAKASNIQKAKTFVQRIVAGGGTEMEGALDVALTGEIDLERLRQIIFLTDGAVGNEEALFQMINDRLGGSRLFTVGIGSSPNSHFMRGAAEMGRGTFTYISNLTEVSKKMSMLFKKLENPILKDLKLEVPDSQEVEMFPPKIPDVYAGEPVVLAFRTPTRLKREIVISGMLAGRSWQEKTDPSKKPKDKGISTLWAREKIAALTAKAIKEHQTESSEFKGDVVKVALAHQMVSQFTSLVAVDDEIARRGEPLKSVPIPVNLPKGMDPRIIQGKEIPAAFYLLPSEEEAGQFDMVSTVGRKIAFADISPPPPPNPGGQTTLQLPQTTNGIWLQFILGFILLSLGWVFLLLMKATQKIPGRG